MNMSTAILQVSHYRLVRGRCPYEGSIGTDLVHATEGVIAHFGLREEAQSILDRFDNNDLGGYVLVHHNCDPFDYWKIEDRTGRSVAMNTNRAGLDRVLDHLNRTTPSCT